MIEVDDNMRFIFRFLLLVLLIIFCFIVVHPVKQKMATKRELEEYEVVYLSEIDDLVKAVMLYGVTNGITYNGTNYMFVVEPKED